MGYILRPWYLMKISKSINTPIVKLLTGVRRVGKSTILKKISNELLSEINFDNKIFINFDSIELLNIRSSESLLEYLLPKINKINGKIYIFLDEVQLVSSI